ncbi:MAG: ATP-binding protein [Thermodesulfovibrionales bacterium]|nr:ATP-binding protein [Thermodesulfovibrionales bacterium]
MFCYLASERIKSNQQLSAEKNALQTATLVSALVNLTDKKDIDAIFKKISLDFKSISDIFIYEKETNTVYPTKQPHKMPPTELLNTDKPMLKWNGLHLTVVYPFNINKEKATLNDKVITANYLLILAYSDKDLQDSINSETLFIKIVSAVFCVVFILIVVLFSHIITNPIKTIAEVLSKVTFGEANLKIKNEYDGEFGLLAQNFNLMIDRLDQAQQEMMAYSRNLEEVVMLRTQRLNRLVDEINEQKDFFDNIINTVGVLIIVFDRSQKVIIFNKTAEMILGYSRSEVVGFPLSDMPFFNDEEKQLISTFEEKSGNRIFESIFKTPIGQEKNIIWQITISKISENNTYLIVTGLDITEKKKIEQFLIESQRFQSISNLLAGLSHNFNNILVGVLGYAGLVRIRLSSELDSQKAEEYNKYLNVIEQSAQRASDLIKHLRGFAKRQEYNEETLEVNELIYEIRDIIHGVFPSNIIINLQTPDNLWSIKADPVNIKQAIMNICINAKEAMQDNGGTLTIKAENINIKNEDNLPLKPGKYVCISISDTGHGIDADKLTMIFDPFFTTKSYITHMGLGLTQSYTIVKNHNGHIEVQSTVGEGSTFKIYLPANN